MSKILLVGDFVSKGKIAGNIMEPVLAYEGHDVYFLPSALISNNFSLGNVAVYDTSDHITNSLRVWRELGLSFDLIFLGYINNQKQKEIIISFIESLENKPLIILDPVMGDNGKLYHGVGEDKINIYKELLEISDICLANITEGKFLGLEDFNSLSKDKKKYILTSLNDDKGFYNLAIDNGIDKQYYEKIDHEFAGTGDLLDALFINYYLQGYDFTKASKLSISKIYQILYKNKEIYPKDIDIHIEKHLSLLEDGGKFAG